MKLTLALVFALILSGCASATPIPTQTRMPPSTPVPTYTPLPSDTATSTAMATRRPTNTATPTGTQEPTKPPTNTPTKAPTKAPSKPPAPTATIAPVVEPTHTAAPAAPPQPPGEYVCEGGTACIKGNINSKGDKIYHFPGCASYNQTQIDTSKGERWFVSEAEAQAAGWRKAGNCP